MTKGEAIGTVAEGEEQDVDATEAGEDAEDGEDTTDYKTRCAVLEAMQGLSSLIPDPELFAEVTASLSLGNSTEDLAQRVAVLKKVAGLKGRSAKSSKDPDAEPSIEEMLDALVKDAISKVAPAIAAGKGISAGQVGKNAGPAKKKEVEGTQRKKRLSGELKDLIGKRGITLR